MKNFLKRKSEPGQSSDDTASRITNETVAEHREKVLAGGRKFKYPLQYQRHKLVINTIIIAVTALVLLTVLGWYLLYVAQDTSKLIYRITQLIPARVATVDGEPVSYSEYLMRYRSSIFYMQKQDAINLSTADGKRQAAYYQRQELTNAERSAYVTKLAHEQKVTVTDKEVDDFIKKDIDARSVSLNAYEKTVLNSYYDWSLDEYRGIVRSELLKRKVSFAVDSEARNKANNLASRVAAGEDFATLAKDNSDDEITKTNGGDSGALPTDSLDADGLIAAAQKLEKDQVSGLIQGVDSYYIIKLISKSSDSVEYRVIKIKLTVFDNKFSSLKEQGKIKEYISVAQ
jgi:hypothetical protein